MNDLDDITGDLPELEAELGTVPIGKELRVAREFTWNGVAYPYVSAGSERGVTITPDGNPATFSQTLHVRADLFPGEPPAYGQVLVVDGASRRVVQTKKSGDALVHLRLEDPGK